MMKQGPTSGRVESSRVETGRVSRGRVESKSAHRCVPFCSAIVQKQVISFRGRDAFESDSFSARRSSSGGKQLSCMTRPPWHEQEACTWKRSRPQWKHRTVCSQKLIGCPCILVAGFVAGAASPLLLGILLLVERHRPGKCFCETHARIDFTGRSVRLRRAAKVAAMNASALEATRAACAPRGLQT